MMIIESISKVKDMNLINIERKNSHLVYRVCFTFCPFFSNLIWLLLLVSTMGQSLDFVGRDGGSKNVSIRNKFRRHCCLETQPTPLSQFLYCPLTRPNPKPYFSSALKVTKILFKAAWVFNIGAEYLYEWKMFFWNRRSIFRFCFR